MDKKNVFLVCFENLSPRIFCLIAQKSCLMKFYRIRRKIAFQNPTKGFCWKNRYIFHPTCDPLFFFLGGGGGGGTKNFVGFSENILKCTFNEIDCKTIFEFFFNEFSSKTFCNSLKLTIKISRNFLRFIF